MGNRLITVFEDRQVKLDLSTEEIRDILSYKDIWGSQNINIQADGTLLMRKYVGFVSSNKTRVQILPKIFSEFGENEVGEGNTLLFRLLYYSGYLPIKELPNPQYVSVYQGDLLEIFVSIFVKRFIRVFTRSMHREYEPSEENIQCIKGKILFQQSILKNFNNRHLHYVSYDELTVNTLLNQIFKTTFLRLLSQSRNAQNKKLLKIALTYMEDVDLVRLSLVIFSKVTFNRLNEIYRPLFNMAKLFYHNHQPGNREGDELYFTFLVPLNELFERYAYKLLCETNFVKANNLEVNYHFPQGPLATCNQKSVFNLEPDITISNKGKVCIILDAKYKNADCIFQADLYQLVAYALHFRCNTLYLLYPLFKGQTPIPCESTHYKIEAAFDSIDLFVVQMDLFKDFDELKEEFDVRLIRSDGRPPKVIHAR